MDSEQNMRYSGQPYSTPNPRWDWAPFGIPTSGDLRCLEGRPSIRYPGASGPFEVWGREALPNYPTWRRSRCAEGSRAQAAGGRGSGRPQTRVLRVAGASDRRGAGSAHEQRPLRGVAPRSRRGGPAPAEEPREQGRNRRVLAWAPQPPLELHSWILTRVQPESASPLPSPAGR